MTDSHRDATRGPAAVAVDILRSSRPKQWVKNLLVFAAPAAAGVMDEAPMAVEALIAFASFCLAASATYLWNDVADREADARHPKKRRRPVASGRLRPVTATVAGAALLLAALGLSLVAAWQLTVVVALYVALTTSYSAVFKHVAVVDLVVVAAGFVLRAVGGAAATDVPISNWFFIVTSFGSMFVVTGKRSGEAADLDHRAGDVRQTLTAYSTDYLRQIRAISIGVVLVAYCLWAFEQAGQGTSSYPLHELSIVPFAVAVLRYELLLDRGQGSAPEDLFFADRGLQAAMVVWGLVYAAALLSA